MKSQELGPYLLLRELSQSALCDTYRAGLRSGEDVERVVLLFSFSSDPDSALWIAETANAGRRALAGLDSPFLSPATDSGQVGGVAYLTYDYISGHSLGLLLERSWQQKLPVPIEHALLITDRLAKALMAAWEHESRALHGFVVPQLVMLSNEGDVRLLGLEVASRLRKLLTNGRVRDETERYLAEEVVPEGQPATTDDVFSLGAILFELVTGEPLPASPENGLVEVARQATAADGSELPTTIVDLLQNSLAPSSSRLDLRSWEARIGDLLASGEYDVNAFNLALYLRTLFPEVDEQREEPSALAAEVLPAPEEEIAEAIEAIEAQPEDSGDGVPLDEAASAFASEDQRTADKQRNRLLGLAAAAAAVVLATVGFIALTGPDPDASTAEPDRAASAEMTAESAAQPSRDAPPQPTVESDAAAIESTPQPAAGPSPEEIEQRVEELLSERSATMESSLRNEFEAKLEELQRQLDEARQAAAAAEATAAAESAAAAAENEPAFTETSIEGTPQSEDMTLATADDWTPLEVAGPSAVEASAIGVPVVDLADALEVDSDAPGAAEPDTVETPILSAVSDTAGTEPSVEAGSPAAGIDEAQDRPPVEAPQGVEQDVPGPPDPSNETLPDVDTEPEAKSAADGMTSTEPTEPAEPDIVPPKILHAAQPLYPVLARRLRKEATVTVRILIGENGRVLEAERLGDEVGYGFDDAALKAARQSEWQPATRDGVPIQVWRTINIDFRP